jgi:hypothetical protein
MESKNDFESEGTPFIDENMAVALDGENIKDISFIDENNMTMVNSWMQLGVA